MSEPFEADLARITSGFRRRCFNCPYDDCGAEVRNYSTILHQHPTIDRFIYVTCSKCSRFWNVCLLCLGDQQSLVTDEAATKHILNKHRTPKKRKKKKTESST